MLPGDDGIEPPAPGAPRKRKSSYYGVRKSVLEQTLNRAYHRASRFRGLEFIGFKR